MLRRISLYFVAISALAGAVYWILPELVGRDSDLGVTRVDRPPSIKERDRLLEAWGPASYAEAEEDWRILDFFQGREAGVFVDVGANDYQHLSNTYLLERRYGWSGIAVDALEEFRSGYEEHRPRTRFRTFYVSDTSDEMTEFYVVEGRREQSTGIKRNAEETPIGYATVEVRQITLDRLLELEGIQAIDFLNMDIEMAEPAALRGFDIDRFRPELVCIEMHKPVAKEIRRYFDDHGYVLLDLWTAMDSRNGFFVHGDLAEETVQRLEEDRRAFAAETARQLD